MPESFELKSEKAVPVFPSVDSLVILLGELSAPLKGLSFSSFVTYFEASILINRIKIDLLRMNADKFSGIKMPEQKFRLL
ncbi:uncharacterized protein isoform X3 [Rhodnius prolixus]|uniref:uncharacterized protein isoform X3 n=1 Tax=Rhodnius prolixus TaxID=13249 RepID=UPI003D18D4D8